MKSKGTELNELEEITIETIQNTIHEKKILKKELTEHLWAVGQLQVA